MVEPQRANRRAPHGSQAFDTFGLPDKMFRARVAARMKEANDFAGHGINTRNVRAFEVVTMETRVGEVFSDRWSVMGLRNDVVELKRRADQRLGEQTILALKAGALTDEFLERGVHSRCRALAEREASLRLHQIKEPAKLHVVVQLRLLLWRQ